MKYRYISDSHVHSDCSRDASDPTMMMCESAARLGLYALTMTDHCESAVFSCSSTSLTARSRTSGEYLISLPMTVSSQTSRPPVNPG